MQAHLKNIAVMLAGAVIGLGSAQFLLREGNAGVNGPWRIWPSRLAPANTPYTLTHYLQQNRLPPDSSQTAVFTAKQDSDGRALSSACSYVITGAFPPARWWSLTLDDDATRKLSSGRVILEADGSLIAHLSQQARPGNWMQLPDHGHFKLVLSFHGPQGVLKEEPSRAELPNISRESC